MHAFWRASGIGYAPISLLSGIEWPPHTKTYWAMKVPISLRTNVIKRIRQKYWKDDHTYDSIHWRMTLCFSWRLIYSWDYFYWRGIWTRYEMNIEHLLLENLMPRSGQQQRQGPIPIRSFGSALRNRQRLPAISCYVRWDREEHVLLYISSDSPIFTVRS